MQVLSLLKRYVCGSKLSTFILLFAIKMKEKWTTFFKKLSETGKW